MDRDHMRSNQYRQFVGILRSGTLMGLLVLAVLTSEALSSNFSIYPTVLELSGSTKSGVVSVINNGTEKLNCQIDVKAWAQDQNGKDVYTDTKEIVFFPKIMTVEPSEQRAIRIGLKGPVGTKEKTYRLFVEEILPQKKAVDAQAPGKISAGLTIAFRYAAPIFVKPARPQEAGRIESMTMSKGVVGVVVKNAGNMHFKLLNVTFRGKSADGKERFFHEESGWYVLNGMARRYEATVPKGACADLTTIEVTAQAAAVSYNEQLIVQRAMCAQ